MYIVRWLMGHPIIATWVLGAIAILLSMGAVNNKSSHKTEDSAISHTVESTQITTESDENNNDATLEVSNENHEAASAPEDDSSAEPATVVTSVDTSASKDDKEASGNDVVTSAVNKVTSVVNDAKETAITNVEKTTENIVEKSANAVSAISSTVKTSTESLTSTVDSENKETTESDTVNKATTTDDNDDKETATQIVKKVAVKQVEEQAVTPNADTDLTQTGAPEILLMAREAYWNNGFDEAAALYQQLIKLKPNEMEYKGELGNVYWRQGYPKKAAELYSEIALPMIENGNTERVANMIGFIGLFYPDKAAKIQQRVISKHNDN